MTLLLTETLHPYLREIRFGESDVASFPRHETCPACGSRQAPVDLVELGQKGWKQRVRLVQCADCDHVYYLNPPSAAYFTRFYLEEWNRERETSGKVEPSRKIKRMAAKLLGDLGRLDPGATVLEIGCGLGAMLAGLQEQGFREIYGTEASDYRAAASAARFPGRIFNGGYDGVPEGLTFDIIYSNHVFEHIYDPADAVRWAAARLRPRGILAVTVPSAWGEPVLNQLLFLPHLHSFCHRSLAAMGRRFGFDCLFWKGAHRPYEVTAVFYRTGEKPPCDAARFTAPADAPEAAPRSQRDRFRNALRSPDGGETVYFALHADEDDCVAMAAVGGVRHVGPLARLLGRFAGPIGKLLAGLGLRKFGNKRLARIRYVVGRFTGDEFGATIVGGADGTALFHIK